MTLNELLAHNYEIIKRRDYVGFRISYTLQDDNTISDWWEITGRDADKKSNWLVCKHTNGDTDITKLFTVENIYQYWMRQLVWNYEVQMGLR